MYLIHCTNDILGLSFASEASALIAAVTSASRACATEEEEDVVMMIVGVEQGSSHTSRTTPAANPG
jgi:hypothetical protein